jgi:hypothetical protein
LLIVKMPSCLCLVRTVSGSITSDCQFMRGKMGKMGTSMNILTEHSDFLRCTNCKSLSTAKGNEINNCDF